MATLTAITISGGTYSINGAEATADPGTVAVGDNVAVTVTASGDAETEVVATVTIGGVEGTYSVTTGADAATVKRFPAWPSFPSFPTF